MLALAQLPAQEITFPPKLWTSTRKPSVQSPHRPIYLCHRLLRLQFIHRQNGKMKTHGTTANSPTLADVKQCESGWGDSRPQIAAFVTVRRFPQKNRSNHHPGRSKNLRWWWFASRSGEMWRREIQVRRDRRWILHKIEKWIESPDWSPSCRREKHENFSICVMESSDSTEPRTWKVESEGNFWSFRVKTKNSTPVAD